MTITNDLKIVKPARGVFGKEKPKKSKPIPKDASIEYLFKEWCVKELVGKIAVKTDIFGNHNFYEWRKNHWFLIQSSDFKHITQDWLSEHFPDKLTASLQKSCREVGWTEIEGLATRNPDSTFRFKGDEVEGRHIVPLKDAYLEITKEGIQILPIDKHLWQTHTIDIENPYKASFNPADEVLSTEDELPKGKHFRELLCFAFPNPEVRVLFQEAMAQTILRSNFSIGVWLYGMPECGKSTFSDLIQKFHRYVVSMKLHNLNDRFEASQLPKASLLYVDETQKGSYDETTFKTIITQGLMTTDVKMKDPITFRPRAKMLVASNFMPKMYSQGDMAEAIYRRLIVFKLTKKIPRESSKENFADVIWNEEKAHVLHWLLRGAHRLICRGKFKRENEWPQEMRDHIDLHKRENNPVLNFVQDMRLEFDKEARMPKAKLIDDFEGYCERERIKNFRGDFLEILLSLSSMGEVASMGDLRVSKENRQRAFPLRYRPKTSQEQAEEKQAVFERHLEEALDLPPF